MKDPNALTGSVYSLPQTGGRQESRYAAYQEEVGFVVIGRNEGERLKRCLDSILSQSHNVVYVDSSSSDGSVEHARSIDVEVISLDSSIPFSAARARNTGFERLLYSWPSLEYVQFIDGDCELVAGWMDVATEFLAKHPAYAAVAGRRVERDPDASVYNKLCNIEWNTPVGDTMTTGGDFLVRVEAFSEVDGFNSTVVAGEEPDLCYRLTRQGWKIRRMGTTMTIHDARMTHFSQWWKRASRTGHAYIHGFVLHRADHEGYYRRQAANSWFWALGYPIFVVGVYLMFGPAAVLLFILYPVQVIRIAARERRRCGGIRNGLIYGAFTMLAKWPQFIGQLRFLKRRLLRTSITIIEYK
jgi:GT2 family glycosyltransferase